LLAQNGTNQAGADGTDEGLRFNRSALTSVKRWLAGGIEFLSSTPPTGAAVTDAVAPPGTSL
jgi:hypothetical protein